MWEEGEFIFNRLLLVEVKFVVDYKSMEITVRSHDRKLAEF